MRNNIRKESICPQCDFDVFLEHSRVQFLNVRGKGEAVIRDYRFFRCDDCSIEFVSGRQSLHNQQKLEYIPFYPHLCQTE